MQRYERFALLTVGSDTVASSRIRAAPVALHAELKGWRVTRLIGTRGTLALILLAPILRPEVVMLQKVPLPRLIMKWICLWSRRVVFDVDDAIYFGYPGEPRGARRLERRVRATIRYAQLTTVSTPTIACDLMGLGASEIAVFPGPAPEISAHRFRERDVVLWLGSPSTYLYVTDMLSSLSADCPDLEVLVVGAPANGGIPPCRELRWTPDRQIEALAVATVGLMPLPRGRWEDRKAAYKVLEYLAHDIVPVVEVGPAVDALLGSHRLSLTVSVEGREWGRAVRKAQETSVDSSWIEARDELFDRLSKKSFAELVLEGRANEG